MNANEKAITIRHSMLPKLAACPKYRPKPGPAGPAAERGNRIDAAVRRAIQGDPGLLEALVPEERGPADWTIKKLLDYKMTGELETREEFLAMHTPGIAHVGTADVLNLKLGWVGDIKTGAVRDYFHQLISYCLACMERTFESEWCGHVFYADQRKVVSYRVTHADANRHISRVLEEVADPNAEPRACEYCDWCALKDTCPAVVRPVEEGLAVIKAPVASLAAMKERLLGDRELLGRFCEQWKAVEKQIAKDALKALKDALEQGEEVPGWRVAKSEGAEFWDVEAILTAARERSAPLEGLIKAMGGTMSGETFRAWCEVIGHVPYESQARKGKEVARLLQVKKKTKQLKD